MSNPRFNKLPAFVLAALCVICFTHESASAQSQSADAKKSEAASSVPDRARLAPAELNFFNPRLQPDASEWKGRAADTGCSCVITIPSMPDDANAGVIDDVNHQQPTGRGASTYTPLTGGQKMRRAFRGAFLSPEGYIRTAVGAAITEATEEDLPHKDTDDRVADGFSRFAIRFGTRATRTLFGSGVYPILFKQDPRYERSKSKNIARRALHAASRVFVTRGDNGELQPNYSRFAGSFTASAIANAWEQSTPGRDRIGWDATMRRFVNSFPNDMLNNIIFREFLPDIIKIFKR